MKKYLKYSIYLIPLLIILFFSLSTQKTKKSSEKNSSTSIIEFNKSFSSSFSLNNDIKNIEWKTTNAEQKFNTLPDEYNIENSDPEKIRDTILKNNNLESSLKSDLGDGDILWKNNINTLFYNGTTKKIDFQFPETKTYKSGFIEDELIKKSTEIVNNLTAIPFLTINSIEYFKEDNYESVKGKKEDSRLAKVGFIQTTSDGKQIIPQNFADSSTVILTIDSSLNPRYLMINKAIKNFNPSQTKINSNINYKEINPSKIHRITPFDVETEDLVSQSENNVLRAKSVDIAYTQINDRLYPIYVISGDIYSNGQKIGEAKFVSPTK